MSAPETTPSSEKIRKRGLTMLTVGAVLFTAILYLMYWLSAHHYHFHFAIIPAAFPFVFVCVGFIEAVSGVPYRRLAERWMSLRGWQRGLLGTFIVVAAFCFILGGITFFIMMFT